LDLDRLVDDHLTGKKLGLSNGIVQGEFCQRFTDHLGAYDRRRTDHEQHGPEDHQSDDRLCDPIPVGRRGDAWDGKHHGIGILVRETHTAQRRNDGRYGNDDEGRESRRGARQSPRRPIEHQTNGRDDGQREAKPEGHSADPIESLFGGKERRNERISRQEEHHRQTKSDAEQWRSFEPGHGHARYGE
jgi:hypothetical protein